MSKLLLGLNAEKVDNTIAKEFDGVGLIRSEYLCRNIGKYITMEECRKNIYSYLTNVCKIFNNKMVWYRFTDLTPNEINTLEGCDYKTIEKYHFIGTKGVRRHLLFLDTFKLECEIIKNIRANYDNIGVIIPYIKDVEEYKKIKSIIHSTGYFGKIGIMAEIPSIIYDIDKIIEKGVDNITIGLNDLTSLMLGTYRESKYHNKMHPTIVRTVQNINKICIENNIDFSIAGYFSKEELQFYKKLKNLTAITVNQLNLYYKLNGRDRIKIENERRNKIENEVCIRT